MATEPRCSSLATMGSCGWFTIAIFIENQARGFRPAVGALRTTVACRPRVVSGHRRRTAGCRAARELSCRIHHNFGLIALNVVTAIGYTDVARAREIRHYFVLHV